MKVETLADITTADGKEIQQAAIQLQPKFLDSQPTHLWPRQAKPGELAKKNWQDYLKHFTKSRDSLPLLDWKHLGNREWKAYYNMETDDKHFGQTMISLVQSS
jgi:hypothetical protein